MANALSRLVEQHEFGVERERGRNFEPPLHTVGQFGSRSLCCVFEANRGKQFECAFVQPLEAGFRAPKMKACAGLVLKPEAHVL